MSQPTEPYPPIGPWGPRSSKQSSATVACHTTAGSLKSGVLIPEICTTRADCTAKYAASDDTWRKTQAQRDADVIPGYCVQCGGRIVPPAHMIQPIRIDATGMWR